MAKGRKGSELFLSVVTAQRIQYDRGTGGAVVKEGSKARWSGGYGPSQYDLCREPGPTVSSIAQNLMPGSIASGKCNWCLPLLLPLLTSSHSCAVLTMVKVCVLSLAPRIDHLSTFRAGRAVDTTVWPPLVAQLDHGRVTLWYLTVERHCQMPMAEICLAWTVATVEKPVIKLGFKSEIPYFEEKKPGNIQRTVCQEVSTLQSVITFSWKKQTRQHQYAIIACELRCCVLNFCINLMDQWWEAELCIHKADDNHHHNKKKLFADSFICCVRPCLCLINKKGVKKDLIFASLLQSLKALHRFSLGVICPDYPFNPPKKGWMDPFREPHKSY